MWNSETYRVKDTNSKKNKTECLKELCQITFQVAPLLLSVCRHVAKSVRLMLSIRRPNDIQGPDIQHREQSGSPDLSPSEWSPHSNTWTLSPSTAPYRQLAILVLLVIAYSILISPVVGISLMVMILIQRSIIITRC